MDMNECGCVWDILKVRLFLYPNNDSKINMHFGNYSVALLFLLLTNVHFLCLSTIMSLLANISINDFV